mgnify:CR=1 FL=1
MGSVCWLEVTFNYTYMRIFQLHIFLAYYHGFTFGKIHYVIYVRSGKYWMESKSGVYTYCRLEDGDLLLERSDIKQMQYGFEILKCCPICKAKCKSKHLKLHMKREHQGKAAGKPEFRRTGMSPCMYLFMYMYMFFMYLALTYFLFRFLIFIS